MVPRYIQLRDVLPKTATERVQKTTLRDEGTAGCWETRGGTRATSGRDAAPRDGRLSRNGDRAR